MCGGLEKGLVCRRLLLFILFTFSISWLAAFGGEWLFPDTEANMARAAFFNYVSMLGPAIAHILTRLITKEGFVDAFLAAGGKKSVKYYWIALLGQMGMLLAAVLLLAAYKGLHISLQYSGTYSIGMFLFNLAFGFTGIVIYFGEEFGWRAYLFPKLEQLTGTIPALIFTGMIWGIWHLPALLSGLNFGKDFPGYPGSNVLLMCLQPILYGIFLTMLTQKSGSVFPAVIAHTVQDHMAGVLPLCLLSEAELAGITVTESFLCNIIILFVFAGISLWVLLRKQ